MSADVVADICAVGLFLRTYRDANGLEAAHRAARRQLAPLLTKIKSSELSVSRATSALSHISGAPWPKGAIEARLAFGGGDSARNRTQKFMPCENLLSPG